VCVEEFLCFPVKWEKSLEYLTNGDDGSLCFQRKPNANALC
jgi:hypothetical protein